MSRATVGATQGGHTKTTWTQAAIDEKSSIAANQEPTSKCCGHAGKRPVGSRLANTPSKRQKSEVRNRHSECEDDGWNDHGTYTYKGESKDDKMQVGESELEVGCQRRALRYIENRPISDKSGELTYR